MQHNYDHKKIEKKWQEKWQQDRLYKTEDRVEGKENFYSLTEFVYPSGNLHVGHWYAFAVPDIFVRFKRMQGYNVLYPTGFDSFGLPAENAAIKRGLNPKNWTNDNMEYMRGQFKTMGASFDWDREIITSDPNYYKWTQWIFGKMFEKGLAYKAESKVNWCPSCKTVLANEQVVSGACERCDSEVEIRKQPQWMLKITDYTEKLLDGLEGLDWPEQIKEQQRNWIGKSQGAEIAFKIKNTDKEIRVFTTRPDTLFGVSYVVLAPEHPLVSELKHSKEVEKYIAKTLKKSELDRQSEQKDKTGIKLEGVWAINPANNEELPVFIADYVLAGYGTGAVMAVPAHDQRDFEFAQKFDLPIKQVIAPFFVDSENPPIEGKEMTPRRIVQAIVKHPTEDKIVQIQWKKQPWKTFVIGGAEEGETYEEAVRREVLEETGYQNIKSLKRVGWQMESHFYAAHKDVNRQAFVQVFEVQLEDLEQQELSSEEQGLHEVVWVPTTEMHKSFNPVSEKPHILAHFNKEPFAYTGEGILINSGNFDGLRSEETREKITKEIGGQLKTTYRLRDWSIGRQRYWGTPIPIVFDPEGVAHLVPEKYLPWILPEDVDFTPTGKPPLAKSVRLKKRTEEVFGKGWTPEVDTMDTFVDSSWYFLRYLDHQNEKEFASLEKQSKWMPVEQYFGGSEQTTLHLLYSRFFQKFLFDQGLVKENEPYKKRLNRGLILGPDGAKMSKSRGNVINPDELVERVGADTVRTYLAFIGPYNEPGSYPWDTGGIAGIRRFLERVIAVVQGVSEKTDSKVENLLQKTIKKVTNDIAEFKFNTAISSMMSFLNQSNGKLSLNQIQTLLKILAPFAPYLTEELWQSQGMSDSIHLQKWPEFREVQDEVVKIAIQIDGKVRGVLEVQVDTEEAQLLESMSNNKDISKWLKDDYQVKKLVPNRIISIVNA